MFWEGEQIPPPSGQSTRAHTYQYIKSSEDGTGGDTDFGPGGGQFPEKKDKEEYIGNQEQEVPVPDSAERDAGLTVPYLQNLPMQRKTPVP